MVYENSQKFSTKFYCEKCDYYANRKSDLLKHFKSNKHNDTKNSQNDTKKFSIKCECGKVYKFNSGFYRHKKNCTFVKNETIILEDSSNNNVSINKKNINETVNCLKEDDYKNMFLKLLDENKEFKDILIKQQTQIGQLIPKIGNNNINNVNNVNQKFNINIFLNEQCKDALNMNEFIQSIQVSLEQLEYTKTHGLEQGLSKTIMENINKLSLYERPLHCTDAKRETIYIKDNNNWEKDKSRMKIKEVIKTTCNKNYEALKTWKETNPDYMENENKKDSFVNIISQLGKPIENIDNKVIKNICKETYVND